MNKKDKTNARRKGLVIRDPIHGIMEFEKIVQMVIDTRYFQRLRKINQNSLLYLVYPSSRNTRFEHSLGSAFLASEWFDNIFDRNRIELSKKFVSDEITRSDSIEIKINETCRLFSEVIKKPKLKIKWKNLVTIAGLTHDLGHGPFSHLLEFSSFLDPSDLLNSLRKERNEILGHAEIWLFLEEKYQSINNKKKARYIDHEDFSIIFLGKIFFYLKDEPFFRDLKNLLIVLGMISKDFKAFIFDKRTSIKFTDDELDILRLLSMTVSGFIDVDRLDYIVRDTYFAGVPYGKIDVKRILKYMMPVLTSNKITNDVAFICKLNDSHMLDHFFVCLYEVYTQVIYHPKNVQFSDDLMKLLETIKNNQEKFKNFLNPIKENMIKWYENSFDLKLLSELEILVDRSGVPIIHKILDRKYPKVPKQVINLPQNTYSPFELSKLNYYQIRVKERKLLKDDNRIYLFNKVGNKYHLYDWESNSIVASKLKDQKFKPQVWATNRQLLKDLESSSLIKRKNQKKIA